MNIGRSTVLISVSFLLCRVGIGRGIGNATADAPSVSDDNHTALDDTGVAALDAGIDGGDNTDTAPSVPATVPAALPKPPAPPKKMPIGFAGFIDPGGAVTWGALVGFEVGASSAFELLVRFPNAGYFPYRAEGNASEFEWGFGIAAGPRRYFKNKEALRGVYFGGLLEYYQVEGSRSFYKWRFGYFGPELQSGFRFDFGRFLFGLGGKFGILFNLYEKRIYDFGWEHKSDEHAPLPLVELSLEIGWIGGGR